MVLTPEQHEEAIADIAALPVRMRRAVHGLSERQLETPYRSEGWTVRQVVHHVADSHMHAFLRLKLALTENLPTIKPYDEAATAKLADARLPIDASVAVLDGVHARWLAVYRGMTTDDWSRAFVHPERDAPMTLSAHMQLYAWHGRHHVAHIVELRRREGW
jgi:hypothetical protein